MRRVLRPNPWYYSLPLAFALILLMFIGAIIHIHFFSPPRAAPLTNPPCAAATGSFSPR